MTEMAETQSWEQLGLTTADSSPQVKDETASGEPQATATPQSLRALCAREGLVLPEIRKELGSEMN